MSKTVLIVLALLATVSLTVFASGAGEAAGGAEPFGRHGWHSWGSGCSGWEERS